MIVYDVTSRESFEHLEGWYNDARQLAAEDCAVVVLGNKTDALSRQVATEEGI